MLPGDLQTFNQAVWLAQSGGKQEAHALLRQLAEAYPDNPNVLLWLAFTSDNLTQARFTLDRVALLEPSNPVLADAYNWLGQAEGSARSVPVPSEPAAPIPQPAPSQALVPVEDPALPPIVVARQTQATFRPQAPTPPPVKTRPEPKLKPEPAPAPFYRVQATFKPTAPRPQEESEKPPELPLPVEPKLNPVTGFTGSLRLLKHALRGE